MSNRQVSCSKLMSRYFLGVLVFILFNYLVFVLQFMFGLRPAPIIILLIFFHILFAMLIWSMVKSVIGDPGRVPIYWGFFSEESQNRNRRYCLLCHSFKPQRCHHCSTCQRCVLNMDHHCPWISNCVGFGNRKFFMLFLFYIILTLIYCLAVEIPLLIMELIAISQKFSPHIIVRGVGVIIQLVFLGVILNFFKFHVELVLSNSSTLDNLQRQRNPNKGPNIYDIDPYQNFVQVFGPNYLFWLIPIRDMTKNNGVIWPKNQ